MFNKRILIPKFLENFDKKLLLQKPLIWSARTHLVLWYSLLLMGIVSIVSYFEPHNLRDNSNTGYWISFLCIIAFVALIIWLIFLLRFNVFKRFGNIKRTDSLTSFCLYFLAIGCFILLPFVHPVMESIKANKNYSDKEIIEDINSFNTKVSLLEYDSLPHQWTNDTFLVVKNIEAPKDYDTDVITKVVKYKYKTIDTAELKTKLSSYDSSQKLSDSLFVFFDCYDYCFVKPYYHSSFGIDSLLFSKEKIFNLSIQNYQKPNVELTKKYIKKIIEKYYYTDYGIKYYADEEGLEPVKNNAQTNHKVTINEKYKIYEIQQSIENILEKKHRFASKEIPFFLRLFFYPTFILTLFVFIFRHTTTKTFFLTLLSLVLISVISGLLIAFSHNYNGINPVYYYYIFWWILVLFLALISFNNNVRNVFSGIAINLFTLSVAFVPLIIINLYYDWLSSQYDSLHWQDYVKSTAYQIRSVVLLAAEIGGSLVLLILLPTLIYKLYRNWYALPQQ